MNELTTQQRPIDSPFHAKSTAAEVIDGVDLSGKFAIVTGGYSGIGVETVRVLAGAGAEVLVPARDLAKAQRALKDLPGTIGAASMDLSDLASVKRFAAEVVAGGRPVDLLINNAGIMACPETRVGPGWELQFATNHIGHFVLTNELAPLLKAAEGARVIALSSSGHKITPIRWDDIHFRKDPYEKWIAYGQSKTANALFAVELDARLKADGVRVFSVHPGGIATPLQRHLPREEMVAMGWFKEDGEMTEAARAVFKTPEQGASTTIWAATSTLLSGKGGVYCEDCNIGAPFEEGMSHIVGVKPWIVDKEEAARLWRETETMIAVA